MGEEAQKLTEQARAVLPMRRLLEQNGSGPRGAGENWKKFVCPFCGGKSATVFEPTGSREKLELFKCFHQPCASNNEARNEAQMVSKFAGVSDRDGWKLWLQQAGVWKEERLPASVLPGSSRRRKVDPLAVVTPSSPIDGLDEDLIQNAVELIRSEGTATVSLLQRRMRLGYARAARVMEELERRGIVGPAQGAEPREILLDEVGGTISGKSGSSGEPRSNEDFAKHSETNLEAVPDGSLKPAGEYNTPDNNQGEYQSRKSSQDSSGPSAETPSATAADRDKKASAPVTPQPAGSDAGATPPDGTGQAEQSAASSPSWGNEGNPNIDDENLRADLENPVGVFGDSGGGDSHLPGGTGAEANGKSGAGGGPGKGGGGRGGGADGGGGSAGGGYGSDDAKALIALQDFYGQLKLDRDDEAMLLRKRGFMPGLSRSLGYRSSRRENRPLLEAMAHRYDLKVLLKAGLWTQGPEGPKPSGKYFGWGPVKKPKARKKAEAAEFGEEVEFEDSEMEWQATNPILIPYFNENGELLQLRPHKDYVKGRGVHLYVARMTADAQARAAEEEGASVHTRQELAVITEGEFKAGALFQVFRGSIGIGAIPGISTSKKETMQKEIQRWLSTIDARRVVVAFDNEEKGDPDLESYKASPAKRYDTEVWARYLAGWLMREGYEATVAWLPKEWRDAKGKADWDGVLAARVSRARESLTQEERAGKDEGAIGRRSWELCRVEVKKDFQGVLASGHESDEHPGLFDSEKERHVKNKLVRLRYARKIPVGGQGEWKIAEALWRLGRDRDFEYSMRAQALAESFKIVSQARCYYHRTPTKFSDKERKKLEQRKREAEEHGERTGNWDAHIFYDELLKGFPVCSSTFSMDPKFVLVKGSYGEDRDRMVVMRNHLATSGLVALDAKSFTAPRDFKLWLEKAGPFTWKAGEKELENLREDINNLSAHMEAFEMTWFGWHARPQLWVAADCAITRDGQFLLPDDYGVIWWAESGYKMADRDSEGEKFVQAPPRWRPDQVLAFKDLKNSAEMDGGSIYRLLPRRNGEIAAEPEALKDLFLELGSRMCETLGSKEGYLVVGSMASFAAAPEFYGRENWFPGLWFHGERGGGKTTLARVAMAFWGFKIESGANLHSGTKVGMQILAQQYCNLPVWYEEYKNSLDSFKVEFIKSLYNRELAAKKEFGNVRREIRTNGIVSGEHTSGDSATMQRFPHVNIAREKRKEDHIKWFQLNGQFFFSLGRHVLQNRAKYVEMFQKYFEDWGKDPALGKADERSRDVHGVGYAGYMALAELLGCVIKKEEAEFRRELIHATLRAVVDAKETVNINVFWRKLLVAWNAGVFGRGEAAKQYFKAVSEPALDGHPPGAVNQGPGFSPERVTLKAWKSYKLFFDPEGVISKMQEHLRKQNDVLPIGQRDLQSQLSKEHYWVKSGNKESRHKQRLGAGKVNRTVWCIDLDRHKEFGYQPVPDEELLKSRDDVGASEWQDPRLGELYQIAFEVEKEELGS